jgi:phage gp29-like protein
MATNDLAAPGGGSPSALDPEKIVPPGTAVDDSNKPFLPELAATWKNVFSPSFNGLLRPDDDTLLLRGRGRGIRIYRELMRDAHCYMVITKRKMSVISRTWMINPASKSPRDKKVAQFVTEQLLRLPFNVICFNLLDAILMGYAVGEVMWSIGDGIRMRNVIARDQARFVFDVNNKLRLLNFGDMLYGDPVPQRKFVVHRFGATDGNPYGLGLGTVIFWLVWFKRQGMQFWAVFLEKFGQPTAVGSYPVGSDLTARQTLLNMMIAISQETAIAIPQGMEIKLLEAMRSGNGSHEQFCRYLDEQMSEAVLLESMSTKQRGGGMNSNHAEVDADTALQLASADAELLADTLNQEPDPDDEDNSPGGLISWLVQYNFPGASNPKIGWNIKKPLDRFNTAQADSLVFKMGFQPSQEYIQDTYGDGWTYAPQNAGTAPLDPGGDASSVQFSGGERPVADAGDLQAQRLARAADPSLQAWIATIKDAVEGAKDLPDLRDRLQQLLPQMNPGDMARTMQMAFTCAQLAGRYDLVKELAT